jgi:hypothetical protein
MTAMSDALTYLIKARPEGTGHAYECKIDGGRVIAYW